MANKTHKGKEVSWKVGNKLAETILDAARKEGLLRGGLVCGSIRRKKDKVGDVDLAVIPKKGKEEALRDFLHKKYKLEGGDKKLTGLVKGVQVDVLFVEREGWGALTMHLTGSKTTNIRQRIKAKNKGYLLNDKGLWKNGERLQCSNNERAIYKQMEWTWLKPEER